jgi:ankyrin repeat protein
MEETSELFESYIRHNKLKAFNDSLDQMTVDSINEITVGPAKNTLLHISCQNGYKNFVKACLRRGADINAQNSNGQTGMHFCYAMGFNDLGEYLKSKGADDTIRNVDGLTVYEGLNKSSLDHL